MKFLKKILIFLRLKKKWIAKKGKVANISVYSGCGVTNTRRYKIVEGKCSIKHSSDGRADDNGYRETITFRPKTNEARVLVWHTMHKETDRYLIILKKRYGNTINVG